MRYAHLIAALATLLSVGSSTSLVAQPATHSTESTPTIGTLLTPRFSWAPPPGPNSVDANLADAYARPPGILPYGPVSILDRNVKRFNSFTEEFGLNIGFSYT